ncbi:Spy/CpxP family protein refolding chaperone [Devosia ginsengisoli]|uniref:Spy/CpxP family protein refolding chaperone n=1 Tax=Devosia ginsengisoli TaxID=400770 RepID=UPI0026E9642C|nr:Spy/CpxP family protein refolding chaperone [Devosia ginsengisoli]MCR6673921.1 Spy/CpxP family protein refolding chaperone [Devosia ginsengisoli]
MKTITTTAIVALMTASIGLTAIVPTYAQDAAPAQEQSFRQGGPGFHLRQDGFGGPGRGGLVDFLGGSTEAVEIALVRLSHAVEMTSEQQALFDTLKTDALAAAETFTTATAALRPADDQAAPGISERLQNRIAFETARLAALEAVQPAATAFFDSLTAEQQTQLTPQRPDRGDRPRHFGKGGPRHMGQQGGPAAPAPASKG